LIYFLEKAGKSKINDLPDVRTPEPSCALISTGMSEIGRDTEAFTLALKNGFVFIDWDSSEAARRTLGCLYSLTSDG